MTVIEEVQETSFEAQVLQAPGLVLVEFSAVWCAPCKRMEPILHDLAGRWMGKVQILKVDVDVSADLAMRYGVMGVPTLLLFRDGQPKGRLTGLQPQNRIEGLVEAEF